MADVLLIVPSFVIIVKNFEEGHQYGKIRRDH